MNPSIPSDLDGCSVARPDASGSLSGTPHTDTPTHRSRPGRVTRRSLLAGSAAALAVTAGCSLPFGGPDPDSFSATYLYVFGLDTDGTLTDVTVRAPLPVGPDGSPVTADLLLPDDVVRDREDRAVFDAAIVETEYGPMLELTAERFEVRPRYYAVTVGDGVGREIEISEDQYDPSNPEHRRIDRRSAGVSVTIGAEYPLGTREPVGEEPILPPTDGHVETVCRETASDSATCHRYETPFYLSYGTATGTRFQSLVTFEGNNEWFSGGWTGNDYRDHATVDVTGPQDGWLAAPGDLVAGNGRYRD